MRAPRDLHAIILAGGLGTRLGRLTVDLPKPMLPIAGRPFLEYVVTWLQRNAIGRVTIATGHRGNVIAEHFGNGDRWGVAIEYSHEAKALGTAGAIRAAAGLTDDEWFLVTNGDSICPFDLVAVVHEAVAPAVAVIAIANVPNADRFGLVDIRATDRSVIAFRPAGRKGPGTINVGTYLLHRSVLDLVPDGRFVSLEHDVLPRLAGPRLRGVHVRSYFIDIGVPESYASLSRDPRTLLTTLGMEHGVRYTDTADRHGES